MNKAREIAFCWITILWSVAAYAQEAGYEEMRDIKAFQSKLNEITAATTSIESDFEQEKHLSFLDERIITKGKFYFKPENKLRWEYLEPFEYLIVLDASDVIIKDGERINKYDMQSNRVFKEINDLMIELVQGNVLNSARYEIGYFESEQHFVVALAPQVEAMQQFLKKILVFFDKIDYSVASIKMLEHGEDYTKMEFGNKKLNKGIADEVFEVN